MSAIRDLFIHILCEQLDAEADAITNETAIAYDLGADSLDEVELVMACEERFGIEIPDEAAETFKTVGDAVAWLEANGATVMPAPQCGWD